MMTEVYKLDMSEGMGVYTQIGEKIGEKIQQKDSESLRKRMEMNQTGKTEQ